MEYLDYDLTLGDEQRELREAAHKFAEDVLRPTGIRLDRLPPREVVADGSPFFEVLRRAAELGYTRLAGPTELGGLALSPLDRHLILEELSWGNVGLAAAIFLAPTPADVALLLEDEAAVREIAAPFYACGDGSVIGCWAITEPDHGSDTLGVLRPELVVRGQGQVVARRDGSHWILRGQKSAWVSNGPVATHAMLNVHLEPGEGFDRAGICLLALDRPGVRRGPPLDKHGMRSLPQGEIFFDDVRVPGRCMVLGMEGFRPYMHQHFAAFNAAVATLGVGLARAAYESALAYAKERVQGGRPIFEHQSVRDRLFRMFSLVQAARSLSRGAYVYNMSRIESGGTARLEHSIAAKVFCTRAALEVATLGVQLHGGVGMTREHRAEMLLRDAAAMTIADGENAFLSQIGASLL